MLPNLSLHIAFGKLLFSAADIAVAFLVQHIVKQKCDSQGLPASMTHHITLIALAAWLFNPYTATISTRGNGDSLVVLMQLGVLLLVRTRQKTHGGAASGDARACSELSSMDSEVTAPGTGRMALAGALYGLLVHWRVFPVIHGPSLILHIWSQSHRVRSSFASASHPAPVPPGAVLPCGRATSTETAIKRCSNTRSAQA